MEKSLAVRYSLYATRCTLSPVYAVSLYAVSLYPVSLYEVSLYAAKLCVLSAISVGYRFTTEFTESNGAQTKLTKLLTAAMQVGDGTMR